MVRMEGPEDDRVGAGRLDELAISCFSGVDMALGRTPVPQIEARLGRIGSLPAREFLRENF